MNRSRISLLAFSALFLALGKARAQYAYVTHPDVLVGESATTAVLPANPLRAFVYCIIASPGKGEPLAPSVVIMGDATIGVPIQHSDRPPPLWGNTGKVWIFSDQIALISCTELVRRRKLGRTSGTAPSPDMPGARTGRTLSGSVGRSKRATKAAISRCSPEIAAIARLGGGGGGIRTHERL